MKLSMTSLVWSALAAGSLLATVGSAFAPPTRIAAQSSLNMVPSTELKQPGTAKMDKPWNELGFEFRPTNSHIKLTHKDGKWGKGELVKVCMYCWRVLFLVLLEGFL